MSSEMEQHLEREDDYESFSEKVTQDSVVSSRHALKTKSFAPMKYLKAVNVMDTAGQMFIFAAKVAALELVRRVSQTRCRPIWWGLQGLYTFQAPPFNWLQRWSPFKEVAQATQSFSKPLLFLSLATAVTSAFEEAEQANATALARHLSSPEPPPHDHPDSEESEEDIPLTDQRALTLHLLKEELEDKGIVLPERMDDAELGRFLVAANGSMSNFVARVKKTVNWRERHHLFSPPELKRWEHLVYWHKHDVQQRPTLIVRLGPAYSTLDRADHPRFAQAAVSQVEAGVLKLGSREDPSITVVVDCECKRTSGFPMERFKSRALLLQDHYPLCLAALLVVNLPPEMRGVAYEVIKVLSPVTQKKVHLKGPHRYMGLLVEHLGTAENIPSFLGGSCRCVVCNNTGIAKLERQAREIDSRQGQLEAVDRSLEEGPDAEYETTEQSYTSMLRLFILGFLMFWIMVAMVAGHSTPKPPHI